MEKLANLVKDFFEFKKTVLLLRKDFISYLKEFYNRSVLEGEDGYPHDYVDSEWSESVLTYSFFDKTLFKFFWIFIKTKKDRIRSKEYEKICDNLDIDPKYPLILMYGAAKSFDINELKEDVWKRRRLVFWLLKLDVADEEFESTKFPEKYELDKMLIVETSDKEWYFEKANFKLKRLTDIKNSEDLKTIAENLRKPRT